MSKIPKEYVIGRNTANIKCPQNLMAIQTEKGTQSILF
jgi:hypothetical protein